jgi:hypothetical protein
MGASFFFSLRGSLSEQVEKLILLKVLTTCTKPPATLLNTCGPTSIDAKPRIRAVKALRIYPDLSTAVKTRCQTAKNFPGNH